MLYGRDPQTVKAEVERLLKKHNLDFLCLQEANDYFKVFNNIEGYDYIASTESWGGKESTILVRSTLKRDRIKFFTYGDGWITVRGGKHAPTGQTQARIDGWLYVRSLHLPTPSFWVNGKIDARRTPAERLDDLVEAMKGLRNYFAFPSVINGRIAAGDWNEAPMTEGEYSPGWLMRWTKAKSWKPASRLGHGWIDWVMGKGVNVTKIFKDTEFREGSDHEPVIFTVVKS